MVWVETDEQTLFCSGIPGAGKTILTSIVIEELTTCFLDNEIIEIVYLCFNFRRQEEQKIDNLLLSLLKQLAECLPSIPTSMKDLYNRHRNNRRRPLLDEVSKAIQSVTALYSRVLLLLIHSMNTERLQAAGRHTYPRYSTPRIISE